MKDFLDRSITLFEGPKWCLIVRWNNFWIRLTFALFFELDVLLNSDFITPLLPVKVSYEFILFFERKMVSFLGNMWYFLDKNEGGGDGSWWFLEGRCFSLFEYLCFSLISQYESSYLFLNFFVFCIIFSDVASLVAVKVFLL